MKVAVTHTRYIHKGGVERYIWDLVKRLCDAGHEVHFFCNFWDEYVDPRVKIHKIPNRWKQIRFMKVWSFDRWLSQRVRRENFDVVHGFSKSSFQDIYTDGSGCLLDYQGYSIEEAGGSSLKRKLKRKSLHQKHVLAVERRRFTRGNFQRIVTMSDLATNQIRHRYGLDETEVMTLYNGIDTERFKPENRETYRTEYLQRVVVEEDCFFVLLVGSDYTRKGVPALLEAAKILKDRGVPGDRQVRFGVVGSDSHAIERSLSTQAKEMGIWDWIKFYGPQDLIARWHAMADLFVLPTRFDAFGNVVLEAMATGVPTLVSSKAGAAEVVQEGKTGWVLEDPSDANTIAERILELVQDEEKRKTMGAAARVAAEEYSWDKHFAQMLEVYEEVAASKRTAPAST